MRNPHSEARRWLVQAEDDLRFAMLGLERGFYAQCCFLCQQAAEKAVKALHYYGGARLVIGHSVTQLLRGLGGAYPHLEELLDTARELDQYYIPTRYPNGLPAGAPCEIYTRAQAQTALHGAEKLVTEVQAVLKAGEGNNDTLA